MKTDDYIEKIITDNLDELNRVEPPEGHFERFENRLAQQLKSGFNWKTVWRIAAAVVFVLLAGNQIRLWVSSGNDKITDLASLSPEYAEVEYYYKTSIQQGINAWDEFAAAGIITDEDRQIMEQELDEFEKKFEEIQKEFQANPYDERVINAMIGYYQSKLNVITMIVNKLQEVKQQKNAGYEEV